MTYQFKVGDRLRTLDGQEFIYLRVESDACVVEFFELVPHPDTERLDWLADPENTISKVMLPGWCSDEYDSLRDAIDAAIQEQAAEAKEQS